MAGKTLSSRAAARSSGISRLFRREMAQEVVALSMLLLVAFLILAIVSYDPADIPGNVWPVNEQPANLGGRAGATLVEVGYRYLGVGLYLAVAMLGVYATLIFFRRRPADWPLRALGAVMLIASFAAFFGGSYAQSGAMPSRGGVVGVTVFSLLNSNFGLTGAYLVLGFVSLLSFLLATDILFYPVVRDLLHPLGRDENAISGPLDLEFIPEPLAFEESDDERERISRSWLGRILKRGEEVEPREEAAPEAEPPAPPAKPRRPGGRRPAVAEEDGAEAEAPAADLGYEQALEAFQLPALDLLNAARKRETANARAEHQRCAEIIRATFAAFKIEVRVTGYTRGPTVTTYEMEIPHDVMLSKIARYKENLALQLRVGKVRIVTTPGKATIGVEVPNKARDMVAFRELLESPEFEQARKEMELPMAIGKDALGAPVIRDLAAMPHLLVGGATGQGKSVFENILLASLLMSRSPKDMRLVMVDPKQVEFTPYVDAPHLLAPVIDESRSAAGVFEWLVEEMERRYTLLKNAGVRKLTEYNELPEKKRREALAEKGMDPDEAPAHLPYLVAIVDELADLMMVAADTKIEELLVRIAQKARAAGIHLILVTQSPRSDVLTGLIKANIPARVSLRVNTGTDSRVVLDQVGAEDLLGKGDLLMIMPGDPKAVRAQSAYIADDELNRVLDCIRGQLRPNYRIDPSRLGAGMAQADDAPPAGIETLDDRFAEAVEQLLAAGRGSASFLRTAMGLGHTRATRLVIQMERAGILGPARGSKEREILITFEEWEERKASGDLTGGSSGDGIYDTTIAA